MTHKLSLIVLGGSGSKIKQIHFSSAKLAGGFLTVVVCIGLVVYGCIDYLKMRTQITAKRQMELRLAEQTNEVTHQREQIQKFAAEINDLQQRILALNQFEDEIRSLADIHRPDDSDGLFGIGGSNPEELNPQVELDESHRELIKEMHRHVDQLNQASVKQHHSFSNLLEQLEEQKNMLAHTPNIRPTEGWVTSKFAYRQSPFTGKREFHKGIDIANQHGTSIVATADGVVSFAGENGAFGKAVIIDHGYGITTRYGHLQKVHKKRGDRVQRGEVIALMGNTGRSTGPHLHYEVRINGVPVDPQKYILN